MSTGLGNAVEIIESSSGRPMEAPQDGSLSASFLAFIAEDHFPCVGAKAALSQGAVRTAEFGTLGDADNDQGLLEALTDFTVMLDAGAYPESTVHSFAALFKAPFGTGELRFEHLLWHQLWRLHRLDMERGMAQAQDVSNDTGSDRFSLSIAGHPYFIIGLHPGASRIARCFRHPTLVFNSHRQFEQLRADGRYQKLQEAIRGRDRALQGSINPNLADFGAASEARQYSGRAVEDHWKCPYDFSSANSSLLGACPRA